MSNTLFQPICLVLTYYMSLINMFPVLSYNKSNLYGGYNVQPTLSVSDHNYHNPAALETPAT